MERLIWLLLDRLLGMCGVMEEAILLARDGGRLGAIVGMFVGRLVMVVGWAFESVDMLAIEASGGRVLDIFIWMLCRLLCMVLCMPLCRLFCMPFWILACILLCMR